MKRALMIAGLWWARMLYMAIFGYVLAILYCVGYAFRCLSTTDRWTRGIVAVEERMEARSAALSREVPHD